MGDCPPILVSLLSLDNIGAWFPIPRLSISCRFHFGCFPVRPSKRSSPPVQADISPVLGELQASAILYLLSKVWVGLDGPWHCVGEVFSIPGSAFLLAEHPQHSDLHVCLLLPLGLTEQVSLGDLLRKRPRCAKESGRSSEMLPAVGRCGKPACPGEAADTLSRESNRYPCMSKPTGSLL